jgi:2'-5' RNA ligase
MRQTGPRPRAFFALWPDQATAAAIGQAAPPGLIEVHEQDLHLTVVFLGPVEASALPMLAELASDIAVPAFVLTLRRIEFWAAPAALVVLPEATPLALVRLHAQLCQRLAPAASAPLAPIERNFRPHVTLATRAKPHTCVELTRGVEWRIGAVSLAVTEPSPGGPRYRRVARRPFALEVHE